MKSEPLNSLLEQVMTIADAKISLPFQERDYLNRWGVYCHCKKLPGGSLLYYAGGKFVSKLGFIRSIDGSITVQKYNPGDWEPAIEPTYNYAKYIIESKIDELEKDEFIESSAKAKNNEERIQLLEQRANDNAAWLVYLLAAYTGAGRFKDAERTLIKFVEKWPIFFTHINLGCMYLHALANNRGMKLQLQSEAKAWANLNLQDLGYTYDHTLGLARRHIQESIRLVPPKYPEMQTLLQSAQSELRRLEKPVI